MTKSPHPSSVDKGELLPVTPDPCPFCGASIAFGLGGYFGHPNIPTDCPAQNIVIGHSDEAKMAAWNTRQAHSLPGDADREQGQIIISGLMEVLDNLLKGEDSAYWLLRERARYWLAGDGEGIAAALTPSALSGDAGEAGDHYTVAMERIENAAVPSHQGTEP